MLSKDGKKEFKEIIDAIFDEGGQNAEMIAEMMEYRGAEYSEEFANEVLKEMEKVILQHTNELHQKFMDAFAKYCC